MLKDTPLAPDFPLPMLAQITEGLSGSDLKELCRNAAMMPVREFVRNAGDNSSLLEQSQLEVRSFGITMLLSANERINISGL